jgi:tape measure domain-containing protein
MANTITVELDLDDLQAKSKLKNFDKKAKKQGAKAGESFSAGFLKSLAGNLGATLLRDAFRGISSEIGNIVKAGQNLEVIEVQFQTLLKSTKAAEKQLKDLQNFAASTPFQLEGLAVSTRQLLSFGVAQKDIIPTLRQLGDLAAASGSRIDELTIPFGRLISTQKLTLIELDKFADRGINLFGQLSKQTGISLGEIRDAVSKGKIPFEEFTTALNTLTGAGGLFFNATQKQSKTLSGVLSTLGDNVFNLRANLGKLFSPLIIKAADAVTKSIQRLNKSVSEISIEQIQKQFIEFNRNVIDYLIMPLELFGNIGKVVFDGVKLAIQGVVASLGFLGGKISEFLGKLRIDNEVTQGLTTFAESSAEVFQQFADNAEASVGSVFDTPIADKAAMFNAELSTALDTTNSVLDEKITQATGTIKKLPKTLSNVAVAANKIINQGIAKTISGGIQSVISSIAKGENALENFGKFLLDTFGSLAIQLGEFYIATGLANLALLTVDPTAQIATGAALVALGSILKAFSGGGSSASSGAGGATGGGALATDESRDIAADDVEDRQTATVFNIEVQGSLTNSEELARFVTDAQNEAREKNGIIDTNIRIA